MLLGPDSLIFNAQNIFFFPFFLFNFRTDVYQTSQNGNHPFQDFGLCEIYFNPEGKDRYAGEIAYLQ